MIDTIKLDAFEVAPRKISIILLPERGSFIAFGSLHLPGDPTTAAVFKDTIKETCVNYRSACVYI